MHLAKWGQSNAIRSPGCDKPQACKEKDFRVSSSSVHGSHIAHHKIAATPMPSGFDFRSPHNPYAHTGLPQWCRAKKDPRAAPRCKYCVPKMTCHRRPLLLLPACLPLLTPARSPAAAAAQTLRRPPRAPPSRCARGSTSPRAGAASRSAGSSARTRTSSSATSRTPSPPTPSTASASRSGTCTG